MKIAVVGMSSVGLPDALLLAQHNEVDVLDVDPKRVAEPSRCVSPIEDAHMECLLPSGRLNLSATLDHTDLAAFKRDADNIL